MDRTQLLAVHQKQMQENVNLAGDVQELIDILGGIDHLLTLVLSSTDIELSETTIKQMHDVITSQSAPEPQAREFTYTFYANDTFCHSLFGDEKGDKLVDVAYSKWLFAVNSILGCISPITWHSLHLFPVDSAFSILFGYVFHSLLIFQTGLWILTVNKKCFTLIISGCEFWIKLFYVIQFNIFWFIYYYSFVYDSVNGFVLFNDMLNACSTLLLLTAIALLDGLQAPVSLKTLGSAVTALTATWLGVYFSWYTFENGEDETIFQLKAIGLSMSCTATLGSSLVILSIFMWKQVFLTVWKRNRCVLITYSPYLKWVKKPRSLSQLDVPLLQTL